MKNLVFILSILLLVSCGQNSQEPTGSIKSTDGSEFNSAVDAKDGSRSLRGEDFSNPILMYGSDFGNFFQSMFERGKFENMLSFTSSESVEVHGREAILDFYKNKLQFGYELGKAKSQNVDGEVITLNYNANIDATTVVVRLNVVVENDSCKIVLPNNLENFPS